MVALCLPGNANKWNVATYTTCSGLNKKKKSGDQAPSRICSTPNALFWLSSSVVGEVETGLMEF